MMKKIIALAICLLFLVSLTSCSSITKFEKCHPTQQQMTKWVGDCEELSIELYICDDDDLMVIDYGEKKTTYYVWWHQNYLTQMSVRDMEAVSSGVQGHHSAIGFWDVELANETCFKLTNGHTTSLPTEITMTRVQTELSEEEIPLPYTDPDSNSGKRLPIAMTIAEILPSCVAFEYKDGNPYCFYAYDDGGKLYRVLWNNFDGLNEKDRIVVDHNDNIVALNYDEYPSGWTPQYEITAISIYSEEEWNAFE